MPMPRDIPIERQDQQTQAARLLALHPVTVEGQWDLRERTREFYGVWLGLGRSGLHLEPTGTGLLIYHNDGPDLLVRLTNQPQIWANKPRIILEVPDLDAIRQHLDVEGIEYQPIQGLYGVDRRIGLWDPSGNRVEIKRLWRTI